LWKSRRQMPKRLGRLRGKLLGGAHIPIGAKWMVGKGIGHVAEDASCSAPLNKRLRNVSESTEL